MRATLLVLLLSALAFGSEHANAGGEDFPFFCWINGNQGESFKIVSDNTYKSGYKMQYFQRGRLTAIMPTYLDNTTDNRHIRVRAKYQSGIFDRHLVAFIGKSTDVFSSADTVNTLHGRYPNSYYFRPMRCQ